MLSDFWSVSDSLKANFRTYVRSYTGRNIEELTDKEFFAANYYFVLNFLTLDAERDSYIRLGTENILDRRKKAYPEDFTDLFIAISREYGYPARMVTGYVLPSEDISEKFLHYWAETWIEGDGWKIYDPALNKLTGTDLENHNFSDHLALIVHETDPISPIIPAQFVDKYKFTVAETFDDPVINYSVEIETDRTYSFD
ncbi:MAG TPA: transglutaminase domain-containing protein, partial [bacterium]|nr:transglutaminase domain-containing protein [bacterium]